MLYIYMVSFKKKLRLVANSVYPSANILLSSKPLIDSDPPNLINSLLTKFFEFIFSLTKEDCNLNLDEKLNFLNNSNLNLFKWLSLFS